MSANLRGILLMCAAMAAFACEDALIKLASVSVPIGQILALIGVGGTAAFAFFATLQGHRIFTPLALDRALVWRNASEMVGTLGIVTALSLIPISTASAILQAAPLVVTAGAALFLGERVGWRRWSAVLAGFAGMLMILRPTGESFDPNALWAVLGVIGLAGRDLVTRRMPKGLPTLVVATWGFATVTLLGLGLFALQAEYVAPPPLALVQIGAALGIGIGAYWMIIEATRAGDVSAISPFRYSRLIFALAIGIVVFNETPDGWTLGGAALIIASGIYTVLRERAQARRTLASAPAAG
jgi:drug/metabolite transporter (DMT)-like permease